MESRGVLDGESYWEAYYSRQGGLKGLEVPSQFAAFVATEFDSGWTIFDIGCGNGRDSLFFSRYGYQVTGFDRSASAISNCRATAEAHGLDAKFEVLDIASLSEKAEEIVESGADKVLVYARFVLHAITEAQQSDLFQFASRIAKDRDVAIAAEYRTDRDRSLPKETSAHYRRFLPAAHVLKEVGDAGFVSTYFAEGFGFAKFGNDDAHVGRFIALDCNV